MRFIRFLKWITRSLILLLIMLFSALATMRLAIHGREVRVPNVKGMTVLQAQETANANGLIVTVEEKFYSSQVPAGQVISQFPTPNARVRRGWRVRVAESLGEQRVTIPNLVGQTERAASLNLRQRGLDFATVAGVMVANAPPDQVVAQVPPPNAADVVSPKVSVLLAQPPPTPAYVMPNFVGRQLAEAKEQISRAGLQLANVSGWTVNPSSVSNVDGGNSNPLPLASTANKSPSSGLVVWQSPMPGTKVTPNTQIKLRVTQ